LLEDKSVVCWGDPANGVLGSAAMPAGRHLAVKVPLENVRSIAGGAGHVCAALEDGTVHCWGHNPFGELGSMAATSSAMPIAVPLPESEEALQVFSGSPSRSTCAQMRSGRVYCWGFNRYGNLGVQVAGAGPSGTPGPMISPPAEVTPWP
jgi:alpha-tubulin suppressor-like RCC1 family protein